MEHREGVLHEPHFNELEQEGQHRFCCLVSVDVIHVQGVAAAAMAGRGKF
jgi:hypothetical protein